MAAPLLYSGLEWDSNLSSYHESLHYYFIITFKNNNKFSFLLFLFIYRFEFIVAIQLGLWICLMFDFVSSMPYKTAGLQSLQ